MTHATQPELLVEPATPRDVPQLAALHRACLPASMISMLGPAAVARYYALVTRSPLEHVLVVRVPDPEEINRQGAKDAKQRGRGEEGALRRDDAAPARHGDDLHADRGGAQLGGINRQGAKDAKKKEGEPRGEGGGAASVPGRNAAEHGNQSPASAWRPWRLGGSSSSSLRSEPPRSEPSSAISAACVLALEPHTVMGRFVRHAPLALAADLARQTLRGAFRRRLIARVREGGGAAGPGVPEVTQIFTAAAQRGRGLGSALLRACEDHLRDLGQVSYCIHTLRDDNDAGIRFYRREGFTQTGTTRSFGDHYLVMTKGLT